ncbi:hypothetical protein FPV67DRAFT_1673853 [Lyophyllum atratum]|nr:hypothetical protein FPV67DRAFT_1673853 [Lyophyllum atratum]
MTRSMSSDEGDMAEMYEGMFYESPVFGPSDITAIQDVMFSHRPSYSTFYSAILVDADCKIGALKCVSVPADIGYTAHKNVHHLAIEYWVQTASLVDEHFVDFAQTSAYRLRVGQINTFVFHRLHDKIWYGNILVLKHDHQGFTAKVNASDLGMIENVVIGAIRDGVVR